jgi:hypothetical protein
MRALEAAQFLLYDGPSATLSHRRQAVRIVTVIQRIEQFLQRHALHRTWENKRTKKTIPSNANQVNSLSALGQPVG